VNRPRPNRLLPVVATWSALLLAVAFVSATFSLHARVDRWQAAHDQGESAIRALGSLNERVDAVRVATVEAAASSSEGALRRDLGAAREEIDRVLADPAVRQFDSVDPRDGVLDAAAALADAETHVNELLAAGDRDRASRSVLLHRDGQRARRAIDHSIRQIRDEVDGLALEMRASNRLARIMLGVACGLAGLVTLLLFFRQRDLQRLISEQHARLEVDQRLTVLLERAPIVLWSVDRELRFRFLKGAALPPPKAGRADAMLGRPLVDWFGADAPGSPTIAHHERALAGQPQRFTAKWQSRTFHAQLEPIREEGEVVGLIGAAVDTTDLAEATERLTASQERIRHLEKMEAIGRLADFVAHDFNNFLTVVLGYAGTVLAELPADAPVRFEIEEIARTAERATWLTRQLLAFSRPTRLEAEPTDVAAALAELAPLLRRQCGAKIEVVLDLDRAAPPVLVHRVQLEQIVLNLALNARDAMPDGGRLTFAVRHERGPEPSLVLSVSDTGVGMADEVRARIFEPFFSTKDDGRGTGLGLAIVDAIVRERSGVITVESAPKRGATFHLRFPAAEGVAAAPDQSTAPPPPLGRGEHVLVVEDDDAVRTLATRTLEAQGYVVASARSGLEALEQVEARDRPLDLVITDERMPRITGKHLVGELRRKQPQLRAILMSTHSGGTEEAAQKAGAGFLAKPFTVAELLTGVRSALDA